MRKPIQFATFSIFLLLITLSCNTAFKTVDLPSFSQPTQSTQQLQTNPVSYSPSIQSTSADDLQAALIRVYQEANPSVVYILTGTGSGSGFVFDTNGHIITNNHVVSNDNNFEVVFANSERKQAKLVGADLDSDLAVLQVDELPSGINPIPLADFNSIQVGQIVVAIGNPFGEQGSMSMGIISGVGRSLPSQRGASYRSSYTLPEVIQTDAPINPGNSGGPLLNLNGELVGVNAAIATENGGSNSGVGFTIPVSAVEKIVPSLIENGKYIYSYMGVGFDDEISLSEQKIYGVSQTQGAYIVSVTPGSPADAAGLVTATTNTGRGGDLIIAVDDYAVNNFAELNSYLVFHTSPGQTIELTILRDERQISIPLTLGARP